MSQAWLIAPNAPAICSTKAIWLRLLICYLKEDKTSVCVYNVRGQCDARCPEVLSHSDLGRCSLSHRMLINKRSAGSTGLKPEERTKMQEAFKHDPDVQVLIATDAAGEGINLQRAHLMVVKFQRRYQMRNRNLEKHGYPWTG